ncbi:MAG: hypothetical protein D8M55_08825 [Chloroflexi bacterium]|nr:hypothetical protein [Chloroflexota bacterium]
MEFLDYFRQPLSGRIGGNKSLPLFSVKRTSLGRQYQPQRVEDSIQFFLRRGAQGARRFALSFPVSADGFRALLNGAEQPFIDQRDGGVVCHGFQQGLFGLAKRLRRLADDHHQPDHFIADFDGRDCRCLAERGRLEFAESLPVDEQGFSRKRHQPAHAIVQRLSHFLCPDFGQAAVGGQHELPGAFILQQQPAEVRA